MVNEGVGSAIGTFIRGLRDSVWKLPQRQIDDAGGPSVSTLSAIEAGQQRLTEQTATKYEAAIEKLGRPIQSNLLRSLAALAAPDLEEQIVGNDAWTWSSNHILFVGRSVTSSNSVTGSSLTMIDGELGGVFQDDTRRDFVALSLRIAQRHPAVTLVSGGDKQRPPLSDYLPGWRVRGAEIRSVGLVDSGTGSRIARAAVDPIAGVWTLEDGLDRAAALGVGPDDLVPAAWAMLLACKASVSGDEYEHPLLAWHKLAQAQITNSSFSRLPADWFLGAAGERLKRELPSGEHLRASSIRALQGWFHEYTAARWEVEVKSIPAALVIHERDTQIGGDIPRDNDLWYYNERQFPRFPQVLKSRGFANLILSNNGVRLTVDYDQPMKWQSIGMGEQFGLVLDEHGVWYPVQTYRD